MVWSTKGPMGYDVVYNSKYPMVRRPPVLREETKKTLLTGVACAGIFALLGFIGVQIVCFNGPIISFKNVSTPLDLSEVYQKSCSNRR